jgi:L-fuculose-phosphate aldolase
MNKVKIEYKQIMADSAKRFYNEHLSPGFDSGDMSIRDMDTGYIYAYPNVKPGFVLYNWAELKPENIAVLDMDGNYIEADFEATVEIPMHIAIYRARPETQVILHSHPLWSSVYACCGKNIPLTLAEQSLFLGGEIICAEYGLVGSQALADNIVRALGKDKKAALLRNHGSVVIGQSINEVFALSDFLEHGAQVALFGQLLGGVLEVDPDNILDPSLLGK